jgi:hypothetical protein
MIEAIFWLVVFILFIGFLVWLVDQPQSIDAQYKKIAKGILIFLLVLAVIFFVAGMLGIGPGFQLPHR